MAAPMQHAKLSKSERKVHKKQMKSRQTLLKHEGIFTSEIPTKILCINNAGLDNGVTQEEVKDVCSKYGSVSEVIMLPKKPYCFVCFLETHDCEIAYKYVNGFLFRKGQDSSQDVYFYASFVSQVPACVAPSSEMPPGLILLTDFVTPDCERRLLEGIIWADSTNETQRTLKHRRVKHYGYEFKYGINNVDPNEPLPEGIPKHCKEFLTRAMEMGVVNHFPDQLTVNQYEPGQGIPPHVDTPSAFEDGLMSLSLGSQVVMDFRHPDGRHLSVFLPPRSLVVMTGESRYIWSHGITPRKSDIVSCDGGLTLVNREIRTSFTFRKLTPLAGINAEKTSQSVSESPSLPDTEQEALRLEQEHVHQVYEEIADHFSGTRHRAWPQIASFVQSQPTGTLLADIGCGNGKYLGINSNIYELGSDRSMNLASICQDRNFPVFVGDILTIPLRSDTFDICLCIAVIHHLSTLTRRCRAVSELLRILRPGGQVLIYVWAMEQERQKTKSKYLRDRKTEETERGGNRDNNNDASAANIGEAAAGGGGGVGSENGSCGFASEKGNGTEGALCGSINPRTNISEGGTGSINNTSKKNPNCTKESCVAILDAPSDMSAISQGTVCNDGLHSDMLKNNADHSPHSGSKSGCQRSDHSAKEDVSSDLERQCTFSGGCKTTCDKTSDKKLSVHVNRTNFKEQDLLVPWQLKNQKAKEEGVDTSTSENTFHRFYHVFTEGELEKLCETVGGSRLVRSYYDQGNWCVILEKL